MNCDDPFLNGETIHGESTRVKNPSLETQVRILSLALGNTCLSIGHVILSKLLKLLLL